MALLRGVFGPSPARFFYYLFVVKVSLIKGRLAAPYEQVQPVPKGGASWFLLIGLRYADWIAMLSSVAQCALTGRLGSS